MIGWGGGLHHIHSTKADGRLDAGQRPVRSATLSQPCTGANHTGTVSVTVTSQHQGTPLAVQLTELSADWLLPLIGSAEDLLLDLLPGGEGLGEAEGVAARLELALGGEGGVERGGHQQLGRQWALGLRLRLAGLVQGREGHPGWRRGRGGGGGVDVSRGTAQPRVIQALLGSGPLSVGARDRKRRRTLHLGTSR